MLGQTALHIAGIWANPSAIQQLVECGANVNARNGDRLGAQTALHSVASRSTKPGNRLACARFLISKGADRTARDYAGQAPHDLLDEEASAELRAVLTP